MKRTWMIALVVGLIAVFGVVSVVSAQRPTLPAPGVNPDGGYGPGWMMGDGFQRGLGGGGMMGGQFADQGYMQDYMQTALAAKLGLTVEAYQQSWESGKTFWDLAEEKGYTLDEAQSLMISARSEALAKMVADGVLTQEQADWMNSRMGQMTPGAGGCLGGGMGGGFRGGRGGMGRWGQDV